MYDPDGDYFYEDEHDITLFQEVYEKENKFYKSKRYLTISELIKILKRAKELYGDVGVSMVYGDKLGYDLYLHYNKTKNLLML